MYQPTGAKIDSERDFLTYTVFSYKDLHVPTAWVK